MIEIPKKSAQELEDDLQKVKGWVYTYWKHYKGDIYQITGFAFECNTNQLMIIYKKMANGYDNISFARSYDEWVSVIQGEVWQPRFVMV